MKNSIIAAGLLGAAAASLVLGVGVANAAPVNGTGLVTPDVIYGSGNANGSFTGVAVPGDYLTQEPVDVLELGLRAKLRFDENGDPQNTFNYDGDSTYLFDLADGNAPAGLAIWNFDFSVNTNPDDFSGNDYPVLSSYTYLLTLDYDPSGATNDLSFDPVGSCNSAAPNDTAIGTNATANGGGTVAGNCTDYAALLSGNNVAQNSWNLGFFDQFLAGAGTGFTGVGEFDITLSAFRGDQLFASTGITVVVTDSTNVVPLPAGLPLLLAGLGGLAMLRRRR